MLHILTERLTHAGSTFRVPSRNHTTNWSSSALLHPIHRAKSAPSSLRNEPFHPIHNDLPFRFNTAEATRVVDSEGLLSFLADVWPGLAAVLPAGYKNSRIPTIRSLNPGLVLCCPISYQFTSFPFAEGRIVMASSPVVTVHPEAPANLEVDNAVCRRP